MSKSGEETSIAQEIKTQITILGGLVALMWVIEIINVVFFQRRVGFYGVTPGNRHLRNHSAQSDWATRHPVRSISAWKLCPFDWQHHSIYCVGLADYAA